MTITYKAPERDTRCLFFYEDKRYTSVHLYICTSVHMTARFVWNDSTDRQYKQGEKQDFESCLQNSTQPESATE